MKLQSVLCYIAIAGVGVALWANDVPRKAPPEKSEDALMRAKLVSTQTIVEGLVKKNFRQVNDAASELLSMCAGEEWESNADETYQAYRNQLKRQSKKLIDQAGVRNLEGATYAYLGVLSTCVDCHSHCRDVLMIAADEPNLVPIPTAVDQDGAVTR